MLTASQRRASVSVALDVTTSLPDNVAPSLAVEPVTKRRFYAIECGKEEYSMLKRALAAMGVLVVLALLGASATHAQTVFQLTTDHCSLVCGPQNSFGTVTLTQDGTNSVLVAVSLLNGNMFVNTGLQGFTFDVAGTATITGLTTGYTAGGSGMQDGFGTFPYTIECTGCGSGGSAPLGSTLNFTVTESGGLAVAGFIQNGDGIFFTADIFSGTTQQTGPVGAPDPGSPTPEPRSMLLFGTGLLLIGAILRRRLV